MLMSPSGTDRRTIIMMAAITVINKDYRFIDGSFWAVSGSPYTVESLWDK